MASRVYRHRYDHVQRSRGAPLAAQTPAVAPPPLAAILRRDTTAVHVRKERLSVAVQDSLVVLVFPGQPAVAPEETVVAYHWHDTGAYYREKFRPLRQRSRVAAAFIDAAGPFTPPVAGEAALLSRCRRDTAVYYRVKRRPARQRSIVLAPFVDAAGPFTPSGADFSVMDITEFTDITTLT